MVHLIAVLAALAGLLAALGNGGYLAMLGSAANRRAPRDPVAVTTLGVALFALLLTTGGSFADVLAIVAGAGSGVVAYQALQGTRARFHSGG
jgi:F0F1-type ATP synthase membrane subunit c/vacuolar-type H+-ATPase subunit K